MNVISNTPNVQWPLKLNKTTKNTSFAVLTIRRVAHAARHRRSVKLGIFANIGPGKWRVGAAFMFVFSLNWQQEMATTLGICDSEHGVSWET